MTAIDVVGLDGDDTLWHNETLFRDTQDRFRELLGQRVDGPLVDERLVEVERRNLALFGYGVKGFTLSLIETAIELTDGAVGATEIETILRWCRDMLAHPVELLPGVAEAIDQLADRARLIIVTKGDLWHQETKVARSGLAEVVDGVEIVAEKDEATYRSVLGRHGIEPERFLMVGNSLRSDVLPVLGIGAHAAHVPFEITWALEHADGDPHDDGYHHLDRLADVATLLDRLSGDA